jgi:hypothetical protein
MLTSTATILIMTLNAPCPSILPGGGAREERNGLNVVLASVREGLAGSYRRGARVILFQARRGALNEQWVQGDREAPKLAASARFLDAMCRAFLVDIRVAEALRRVP